MSATMRPKLVISVSGGVVQGMYCNGPFQTMDADVVIVDHDNLNDAQDPDKVVDSDSVEDREVAGCPHEPDYRWAE